MSCLRSLAQLIPRIRVKLHPSTRLILTVVCIVSALDGWSIVSPRTTNLYDEAFDLLDPEVWRILFICLAVISLFVLLTKAVTTVLTLFILVCKSMADCVFGYSIIQQAGIAGVAGASKWVGLAVLCVGHGFWNAIGRE